MNIKTTIILLILLVGGTLAVWLSQPKVGDAAKKETEEDPSKKTKYVFEPQPEPKSITRVIVERPGKPRIVWERSAKEENPNQMEDWRFVEPIKGPTENYLIDSFVSTISQAQSRSAFEPGKEGAVALKDTGLDAPTGVVTLVTKDKEYTLEIGRKAALSEDTYVREGGEAKAHRVDRDMVREVTKELKDFRSKRLVSSMPQNAKSLRIEHDGKAYAFSQDEKGDWIIDEPVKDRANKDEVMTVARGFNALNVEDFVVDAATDLSKYGLDKPYMRAVLVTETKKNKPPTTTQQSQPSVPVDEVVRKEFAVDIGAFADIKEQKRYAKLADQPWIVAINTSSVTPLTPNLRKLRDARIMHFKAADATELEVTMNGQTATVKKVNNQWAGEGDLAELDAGAVGQIVEALEDFTALDFVDVPDPAKTGLETPRGMLKLTVRGIPAAIGVKIGKNTDSGRNTYVQIDGRSGVIVVDAAQVDKMLVSPLSLRTREIFQAPGVIRSLDVTRGTTHYVLTNEAGGWKMSEPAGATHDANGVQEVARDLSILRARRVVAKDDFGAYGFDKPAATVKFTVEKAVVGPASSAPSQPAPAPEMSEHTLVVARHQNTPYCRIDNSPYIFELDESIYRVMTGELIDRKLLNIKESEITAIDIDAPGGKLTFRLDNGKWIYELDPFVQLTPKKMKDFATDLAGLRVEEYIAYSGGNLEAEGLANARLTLTLTLTDGKKIVLKADNERAGDLPRKAALPDLGRIFMLRYGDIEKMIRPLDFYLKPEAEPTKPGSQPEMDMPDLQGLQGAGE